MEDAVICETTALDDAHALSLQIEALSFKMNTLLKPLARVAIYKDDPNATMALVRKMPPCLERTELRAYHIRRMEMNYEYRLKYASEASMEIA